MPSILSELSSKMYPKLDEELRNLISLADGQEFKELQRMLLYQMGWVGENTANTAQGKRIRPLLVLLTTGAAGGNWRDALSSAAAVELLHNFSLIHDDIEDDSPLRRGRPTIWKKWGIPQAINTGDTVFTLSNIANLRLNRSKTPEIALKASELLQATCLQLTQGQHLDLSFETRPDISLQDYWTMIQGKTAALIGTSAKLGAIIAEADEDKQINYHKYGLSLGLAFQIQDDLLGIWGDVDKTVKSVESDLKSGKKTLPILYGLSQEGVFARRWSAGPIKQDELPSLSQQLIEEGAQEYTIGMVEYYTDRAVSALENANPEGKYGSALFELTNNLLKREY